MPIKDEQMITEICLDSIEKYTKVSYEILLVDDGSAEKTQNYLKTYKEKHQNIELIRNDTSLGWPKAINQGIEKSSGDYICFINLNANNSF